MWAPPILELEITPQTAQSVAAFVVSDKGAPMVAGREATPKDAANTEHLMAYWTHGEGAAKINWGVPGDFDRCVTELSKHVGPDIVKGLCSNLHEKATGARPGHAPGEQAAHQAKKAAH